MSTKFYRPKLERLEERQLLAANVWFEESGQQLGSNHDAVELGDLDGDGDLDAFFGCRGLPDVPTCSETQVWLNNGNAQFSKGWSHRVTTVAEVGLGDLDNDGDLDAFFVRASPFGNQPDEIWLNDGQGNFEDSRQRLNDVINRVVALGDVDGDGDLDAVSGGVNQPPKVWLNDGSGNFTDSRQNLAWERWSSSVALGDVDGDGDLDFWLGAGTDSTTPNRLYLNDGEGKFTDSGQKLNPVSTGDVAFGDLDGDGDLDAYLANGNQRGGNSPDRVWMNDGTGQFTDSGQLLGRSNGRSVELGDVDGDGDIDAVVGNGTTLGSVRGQPNVVWLNDGSGVFTAGQELGDAATTSVALGDIDNDGDLDALFANLGQDNQVWFNTQPIAGDADRDGVFNQLDIILVLQSAKYQTGEPADWAQGDFNRDGVFDQLDIVAALQTGKFGIA